MSPDDPAEPTGGGRRTWSPTSYRDRDDDEPRRRPGAGARSRLERALRTPPIRGRRVRRTIRHIDPWSVLKLSLLFYAAIFLIICVASTVLWAGARASGSLDNVEDFVTSIGGFGKCVPIEGPEATTTTTSTTLASGEDDQFGASRTTDEGSGGATTDDTRADTTTNDEDCPQGEKLVGGFKFEDARIFQGFAFGGVVLVLAGTGSALVLVLLFNLMSDLTGGLQVWVVDEEPRRRRSGDAGGGGSGSPPRRPRD
jgi:hypothetical protein